MNPEEIDFKSLVIRALSKGPAAGMTRTDIKKFMYNPHNCDHPAGEGGYVFEGGVMCILCVEASKKQNWSFLNTAIRELVRENELRLIPGRYKWQLVPRKKPPKSAAKIPKSRKQPSLSKTKKTKSKSKSKSRSKSKSKSRSKSKSKSRSKSK